MQVVQLQYFEEKDALLIGLSHKVRNFVELDIQITEEPAGADEEGGGREIKFGVSNVAQRRLDSSIASTWQLDLHDLANADQNKPKKLSLRIKARKEVVS